MSAAEVLVWGGAAASLLASLGLWRARGVYDRLHYLAPPALVGGAAVVVAVAVEEGLSGRTLKALLTALVLALSNSVLTQATARAERVRRGRGEGEEQ